MKSRYQSLVPKNKKCSVLVLLFALVPLFTFAVILSLGVSAIPRFSSRTITLNFGDISGKYGAEVISINSTEASSYTFHIVNFSNPNSKVEVFTSSAKPSLSFVSLTETFKLESKQSLELPNKRFRTGCNFLMHDEPIYLLPNSSLEYTPTNTTNYIQWCLFTQREQYVQFLMDGHFNCPQTFKNSTGSSPSVLFSISEASLYYVAIEANSNLSAEALTINITVNRSYYDTSKLLNFSSSDCNNPLTPGSICKIKLCDGYLTCQNSAINYVTFESTEPVLLEYTIFKTFWLSWKERIVIFTIAAIFVTVVCITIFVVVVRLCCNRCSKGTQNNSINVITYVPNKSGILCRYDRCCFICQGAAATAFILAFITIFIALQFNSVDSLSDTTKTVTIDNKYPILVGQYQSVSSIEITRIFPVAETVSVFEVHCSTLNASSGPIFSYFKLSNSDKECSNLSVKSPNCSIPICNKWMCLNNKQNMCIFANATSPDELTVDTQPVLYGGRITVYLIILSMIMLLLGVSIVIFLLIICVYTSCSSTFIKCLVSLKKRKICILIGIFLLAACLILVASLALLLINPWKFSDYAVVANQTGPGFTMLHQNLSSFVSSELDVDFSHEKGNSSVEIYAVPWNDISVLHETVDNYVDCSSFPCVINKYLYVVRSKQTDLKYNITDCSNVSDFQFRISIFDDKTKYNNFITNQSYQPAKSSILNKTNCRQFFFRYSDVDMKMPAAYHFTVVHFAYPPDYLDNIHDHNIRFKVSFDASIAYYMLPSNTIPVLDTSDTIESRSFYLNHSNCILAKLTRNDSAVSVHITNKNFFGTTLGIILISIAVTTTAMLVLLTITILTCWCHFSKKERLQQNERPSLLSDDSTSSITHYATQVNRRKLQTITGSQYLSRDEGIGAIASSSDSDDTDRQDIVNEFTYRRQLNQDAPSDSGYSSGGCSSTSSVDHHRKCTTPKNTSTHQQTLLCDVIPEESSVTDSALPPEINSLSSQEITASSTTPTVQPAHQLTDVVIADFEKGKATYCPTTKKYHFENGGTNITETDSVYEGQSNPVKNPLNEEFLKIMKSVFGKLTKLQLQANGLIHHCDQSGVTLIVPEGAVEQPATVWFGACLCSDKFNFGDYVPLTPIAWVYITQKLKKPAELYLPHYMDVDKAIGIKAKLLRLTATDDCHFKFQRCDDNQFDIETSVFKLLSPHFCSNCIASTYEIYEEIPKRYLIGKCFKETIDKGYFQVEVEYIFLYFQQTCKKMVESQCAKTEFSAPIFQPVIFDSSYVSLTFEPDDDIGWTRNNGEFSIPTVSIEQINHYKVMNGDIKNLKNLELFEEIYKYPPRIKVQFISISKIMPPKTVTVKFDGVKSFPGSLPVTNAIILKLDNVMPESSISIVSETDSDGAFSKDTDPDLGDMLQIITTETCVNDMWFIFGYHIGISTSVLTEIATRCTTSVRCTWEVILHWRSRNKTASWEPLAEALVKIELPDVAHKLRDRFVPNKADTSPRETGRYCSLCKKNHFTIHDVPDEILNSPPKMKDLVDIIASKIEDKYFLFGTLIGLNLSVLRAIETERRTCKERFIEVLSRWINDDPNNVTWRTIIQILQADALQASAIADKAIEHLCNL